MTWTLDAAVGQLTRPTKHRVIDPVTGEARWVTAQPLLVQLVLAIANSGAATAHKASNGTPMPISAGALDIYQDIEKTTAERWWAVHHLHHGHGRSTLAGRLRAWASVVQADEELATEAERLAVGWVKAITGLLQPLRRREIIGQCPGCGTRYILRDDDGETIKAPALVLMYSIDDKPLAATCQECGATWEGHAIMDLAAVINGEPSWQRK